MSHIWEQIIIRNSFAGLFWLCNHQKRFAQASSTYIFFWTCKRHLHYRLLPGQILVIVVVTVQHLFPRQCILHMTIIIMIMVMMIVIIMSFVYVLWLMFPAVRIDVSSTEGGRWMENNIRRCVAEWLLRSGDDINW